MKQLLTLTLAVCCFVCTLSAQDKKEENPLGWKKGGSIGFDLTGMSILNPRLGAGANRFGFGGLANFFANKKSEKSFWDNSSSLQLSALRIGGKDQPFQKNVDILRLNSRYGYNLKKDVLFFAIDGAAETQLLATYSGNLLKKDQADPKSELLTKFFAPVRLQVSPGLDYKPNPHLSFFFAPISFSLLYVSDDRLARISDLTVEAPPLGNKKGSNSRAQWGYALKGAYTNKFFKDKVAVSSKVGWFADYTENLNGNILWQNSLDLAIFKGLSLNLYGDLFYDHFTKVQVDVPDPIPANKTIEDYLRLKPSYIGGFLLKYSRIF